MFILPHQAVWPAFSRFSGRIGGWVPYKTNKENEMLKIYPVSLGCPKNRVDTEHLLGGLELVSGLKTVDRAKGADCVFINTCGFIGPAVEEAVQTVLETGMEIADFSRKPLLAVGGCLVGRYGAEALAEDLPEVDLWLHNKDLERWPQMLAEALAARGAPGASAVRTAAENQAGRVPNGTERILSTGPAYAWLKISEGCSQRCSFCTIPGIRGPLRSVPAELLALEAQSLLDRGVKEIALVAQDLTAWGRDLGEKHGLKTLLEKLLPLKGLKRLRLMYLYPAGLTNGLLAFLRSAGPPFVPYFDVPLQHAHPDILKRMGRPFAHNPFAVVERIREHFPEAALRTSLITGFPGEGPEHFKELKRFVAESRFTHLGVFAYQAEEGTPAASLPHQVPTRVKVSRRNAIMKLQAGISAELLAEYAGRDMEILLDAPSPEWPGLYLGRAWFQAPEIDGITYVSGEGLNAGDLVTAQINAAHTYDLEALA